MLDIPDRPLLDKDRLIGECARLAVPIDITQLKAEVESLPVSLWGTTGGRVGVHSKAEALFLRGFAPAEGSKPIEDRPVFARLPYLHQFIHETVGAVPLRCLLARLLAATSIPMHVDRAPYFGKSLRLHIPIITNPRVFMLCGNSAFCMSSGEVWALNNSAAHGVINADPVEARTHVICDFLPSVRLLELLQTGERGLGLSLAQAQQRAGLSLSDMVAATG